MNQNLLLKYISGKASQREKEEVAAWIDADAANLKEFMSLRKSYDALVWQDADELKTGRDKLLSLRTFTMKAMRIAAIFVLAFGLSSQKAIRNSSPARRTEWKNPGQKNPSRHGQPSRLGGKPPKRRAERQ